MTFVPVFSGLHFLFAYFLSIVFLLLKCSVTQCVCVYVCIPVCMYGQADGLTGKQTDGWTDGQMDRWILWGGHRRASELTCWLEDNLPESILCFH